MSILTKINQKESLNKIEATAPILYTKVLAVLSKGETLTAREIAKRIGLSTRQDIQPRLNELRDKYHFIQENGKKYDKETNRNVIAYKLVENDYEI